MVAIRKSKKKGLGRATKRMRMKQDFDCNWDLVLKRGMYEMHHRFLEMYRDKPYSEEIVTLSPVGTKEAISQSYMTIEGKRELAWIG